MTVAQLGALMPKSSIEKGVLAALVGSLLISFDPVFIRFSGTGGFDTAFLFGLFTAISMSSVIQVTDQRGLIRVMKQSGWPLIISSLLIVGSASTFVLSVKHTDVSNTMIIMSGRPVTTAAFSWLYLREKTSPALLAAIVGVILGMGIVVSGSLESPHLLGDALALLTVIFLGLNGALLRRYPEVSRMAVVGLAGFFMALIMFFPAQPSSYTLSTWLIMGAMGLLSAPIGRVLNGVSVRYIPAAEAALITLSSTIFAPIWAFIIFREAPTSATLLGGAVVLATIFGYIQWTRKRR